MDRESVDNERRRLSAGPERRDPARDRAQEDELGQRPVGAEALTRRRRRRRDFPPSSISQMISKRLGSDWLEL